ncbi:hypothetical protein SAMN04244560_01931 [Thermoanaerobacter thermohydrosulfuricus]|uniref:Uncharacterized protein n=1 Tax=Thermoanaerobacter thermohydrosulfuricus TaxID=1516 RepID=A0A1G7SA82_THETY|nr:hypothetical protein [Thermoanaerobacter thermohydrosulfuricus]SDG19090.1 hypothetical protein SAMN04244560_01931 [Thermoanaerobacter thermohydrosulfuricus]
MVRQALTEVVRYMKSLTSAVTAGFVKFIPISYVHEPPKDISIYYSENGYSDALPSNLLEWFYKKVRVSSLTKDVNGWSYKPGGKLKPCRGIVIDFEGYNGDSYSYFLCESEIESIDKNTGYFTSHLWLPDEPPEKEIFNWWVYQSINRAAHNIVQEVFKEVEMAATFESTYLTSSSFVAELMNFNVLPVSTSLETDIANLVLSLQLPVVENVSLDKLMKIRINDGEAFQNFRIELEKNLRELRLIENKELLMKKLENVQHELSKVQVHEVEKKLNKIKRNTLGDVVLLTASLASTMQISGISLVGIATAVAYGIKNIMEYSSVIKENPAYFLWKLNK